jgi:lipopolysaccharide transport system ATP-binding protein
VQPIIEVSGLAKQYRLGKRAAYATLRDALHGLARSPGAWFGKGGAAQAAPLLWALNDVSFTVRRGERVGIIGRNGAGKTTLLKILSRITEPTRGRVVMRGRVASLLEVGTGFHPELSGRENIYLNGAILGMSRAEIARRFDEIVGFAEVERFLDTPVKHYSSGMYVRLAFAVAAHLDPEILIVDEVLAVGDAHFQRKCLGKMSEVSQGGKTVLFVSHQMQAVEQLCSRALLIEAGALAADGPPKEVIERYLGSCAGAVAGRALLERGDRAGSGEYRFADVWFSDGRGRRVEGFHTGEPAAIHALVVPVGPARAKRAAASLCVRDRSGFRLFTLASSLKDRELALDGPTELCWRVAGLPLLENEFRCDLYVGGGGGNDPIDYVLDAFLLPVFPTDCFGTGRVQTRGLDAVFLDFEVTAAGRPEAA